MSRQLLNLPINIPWRQIAVSPDMMDKTFCNKKFPFAWRSSMAISVYEPKPEDLPEELCGDQITYIKVTTSITGYQASKEELDALEKYAVGLSINFPNIPKEDMIDAFDQIQLLFAYLACYGVLLNVAVFPYPNTNKKLIERVRIDFSKLQRRDAPVNSPLFDPGAELDNPFIHSSGVKFDSGQPQNSLTNLIALGNGTDAELDLHSKMVITFPANQVVAAVESKIVYLNNAVIKMEAFNTNGSVGTKSSDSEPNQVHTLFIEGVSIEKVLITTTGGKSSLLEFAYFVEGKEEKIELENYPHIIDFEPKRRDLYQAATEAGEVLTGSRSALSTTKALTHTESTENSVSFDAGVKAVVPIPEFPIGVDASVKTKQTNKETDQDQWTVQTDASRERRETQGTTTQLSQMYNLLTGYHAGTNRASFLSLARPHVLQPTDFRTFIQGLRAIEGMQDYFFIVSRPKEIEGLCIEASLETGNYSENTEIIEPPEEYYETYFDYPVFLQVNGGNGSGSFWLGADGGECKDLNFNEKLPEQFVVDQRQERKRLEGNALETGWDEGHPGVALISGISENVQNLKYNVVAGELIVTAKLCSKAGESGLFSGDAGDQAIFDGVFRVFMRSDLPKTSHKESHADIGNLVVTSRSLCTCFKSGDCIEVVHVPPPKEDPIIIDRIVDETPIRINKAIMTRYARSQNRMPLEKAFLSKVQTALTRSHSSTSRHSFDDKVGFLESDYLKNQIISLLPKEYLKTPLSKIEKLPKEIARALGENFTVGEALSMDLAKFARNTALSIKDATKVRHLLLGLPDVSKDENSTDIDNEYSNGIK